MSTKERLKKIISTLGMSVSSFETSINSSNGYVNSITKGIGLDKLEYILEKYPIINIEWLLFGKGDMFTNLDKNQLNLYEEVVIAGETSQVAEMDAVYERKIDINSIARGARDIIVHHGESMIEFPSGCNLFVKKLDDIGLIIYGKPYVIETKEFRITKNIHKSKDDSILIAKSTNEETYANGSRIHEDIEIRKKDIVSISSIICYFYYI